MRLMKGESGHSFLSGKLHFPRRSVPQYVETPQWKHLQTFRSISQRSFFILLLFGEKSEHLSIFEKEIGGKECALFNHPGIYTRITKFVPWIRKTIKAGKCGNSQKS